jgi:glycosyltransferase involved in cell wall biosynthesis
MMFGVPTTVVDRTQTPAVPRRQVAAARRATGRLRIATVQYGDFYHTRQKLQAGEPETYYGQQQTIETMSRLTSGCDHLFIGLGSEPYREVSGRGVFVAPIEPPKWPGMPGRWHQRWRAQRILSELRAFAPSHLLLRCNDVVGGTLLAWASRHALPTVVLIAARFDPQSALCRRFCALANRSNVAFVANHNRVSTESLVECGLQPSKALAWDYVHEARPEQFNTKALPASGEISVVFAGSLSPLKGVLDVVNGCRQARAAGWPLRLTVCGDGPLLGQVRSAASEGWLEATGSISQQQVLRRMRDSQVVVVPSHHAFPEGLPLVLYEGLATRTPVLLSDHPVFRRYFENDRGVRFFSAGDAGALAAALGKLLGDAGSYARLSAETASVWQSVQCETKFHEVVDRIAAQWDIELARPGPRLASCPTAKQTGQLA